MVQDYKLPLKQSYENSTRYGEKTIQIEEEVLLSKLITTLNGLLPKQEWKKYTLKTNTVINNWTNPVIIKEYPYPHYRHDWWISPYYSSTESTFLSDNITQVKASTGNLSIPKGVYNLELSDNLNEKTIY